MKILLSTLNAKYIHINLAIRLLYELNKHHDGLSWKEFTIKEDKDEIADYCKDYEVVAFSCYIWNITQTLEVARKIKTINPRIKILLGGPEVSYDWEDVICRDEVDFIITGEGETPFQEFLENYPAIENMANLIRKDNGEIKYFQKTEIFDLQNFRGIQPYLNDDPAELANKVCYIETSRGCPYKCEFCLASLDNKVRYLPNETIKEHLLYLMKYGKVIKFLDRTFNIKRDFTIDIFTFILANYRPENVFQFEITADILHPDIIKFIDEKVPVGLFRFEIGIQTVNQKANLEVSRKQSFEKTKSIIKQLEHKVEMHLDLIVGLALDEFEDIKYSFEEVFKLHAPELQLGFLKFLKGTPVRHKAAQHGFIYDPNPPYQIIESNYLTKFQLEEIVKLENALEIYWNKKRTTRTLKYVTANYSTFDFLMNLGKYFGTKREFHKYGLDDVFEILNEFIDLNYPSDKVLKELVGIDYYLFHKRKPKPLFLQEIDKSDKNFIVKSIENKAQQRGQHLAFELSFDYNLFEKENIVFNNSSVFLVQYNGVDKAAAVSISN